MKLDVTPYANNIFEQPWWLDAVAPGRWDEIIVKEKDIVIGRFPYCYNNTSNSKILSLPVLTQTCGLWVKPITNKNGNEHLSYYKKVIEESLDNLPPFKSLSLSLAPSVQYFLPFVWHGFEVSPRITYRLNDLNDLDMVYNNFSKTVKKNIKSALNKVFIQKEVSLDILMDIMKKTFAAQNREYLISKETLLRIISASQMHNAGKMYTAIDGSGNIHACSYFVYDDNVFYYLIAGSDPAFRASGAQTLILWEAIKDAAKVSKIFDFEGSMIEGIETFFRRFGAEPTVYYEIRKQSWIDEIKTVSKPHIKKILGYKM